MNDVTVWPGSSTSPPSDPRRETVWYGLAANGLAANGLAANSLLRVFRRSDFIYTKNSAIGRSDFIYTKNMSDQRFSQKFDGGDASENCDFQRGKQRLVWCKIFEYHKMRAVRSMISQKFDGGDVDENRHFVKGK